eukprot:4372109-Pyramimonas_sp.AAC.1
MGVGDFHKAYDHVPHALIIRNHQRRGIPRIVTAAWLREIRGSVSEMLLPGLPPSRPVSRSRSPLQGDPEAPFQFSLFADDAVREF